MPPGYHFLLGNVYIEASLLIFILGILIMVLNNIRREIKEWKALFIAGFLIFVITLYLLELCLIFPMLAPFLYDNNECLLVIIWGILWVLCMYGTIVPLRKYAIERFGYEYPMKKKNAGNEKFKEE